MTYSRAKLILDPVSNKIKGVFEKEGGALIKMEDNNSTIPLRDALKELIKEYKDTRCITDTFRSNLNIHRTKCNIFVRGTTTNVIEFLIVLGLNRAVVNERELREWLQA